MINAGRVLIIPKGEWTNLESYEMLDLVTRGDIAYIARQASVGVDPATDTQLTYWQPFGTAAKIATTTTPGLVMPDGTTVTIDATGLISANIGISDINNVTITSISNGQILQYNSSTQRWENKSLGSAASRNATSSITSGSTDLIESGAVNSLKQTLEQSIAAKLGASDIANNLTTATAGKVLDARQGKALNDSKADQSLIATVQTTLVASKAYAIGEQFVYQGLLYKVTTAIAQGGTITINGNCELSKDVTTQIKGQIIYDANVSIAAGAGWTDLPIDYSELEKYSRVIISCAIGPSNSNQIGSLVLTKKDVDLVKSSSAYSFINGGYISGTWYSVQFAVRNNSSTQKVSIICMVSGYSGWAMHHVTITGIG